LKKKFQKETEEIKKEIFILYFSVCVAIASKMYEDRFYGNSCYSLWFYGRGNEILQNFNLAEFVVLKTLDYEFYVNYETKG